MKSFLEFIGSRPIVNAANYLNTFCFKQTLMSIENNIFIVWLKKEKSLNCLNDVINRVCSLISCLSTVGDLPDVLFLCAVIRVEFEDIDI